jgi:hypothetical protein
MRVGEPGAAVQEAREAVGRKLVAVVQHLALRQAVDDEEDHQLGPRRGACRAIGRGTSGEQHSGHEGGKNGNAPT